MVLSMSIPPYPDVRCQTVELTDRGPGLMATSSRFGWTTPTRCWTPTSRDYLPNVEVEVEVEVEVI
jgi:hypothetical protein